MQCVGAGGGRGRVAWASSMRAASFTPRVLLLLFRRSSVWGTYRRFRWMSLGCRWVSGDCFGVGSGILVPLIPGLVGN